MFPYQCVVGQTLICFVYSENKAVPILKPKRQIGKHPRTRTKQIDQHLHRCDKSPTAA